MHSLRINCRILIYCTCHFWGSSPFFAYLASSFCKSLQCLISTLTWGGKGDHVIRLTYSVVLWRRRDTTDKCLWHVWGVLTLNGTHWVSHSPSWCVLPRSTLLRLQGSLERTVPSGACVLSFLRSKPLGWLGAWRVHCASYAPLQSWPLSFPGVPCVSTGELISGCYRPGLCEPSGSQEDTVSNWQPAHSLAEAVVSGAKIASAPCLLPMAVTHLSFCFPGGRALNDSQLALLRYLLGLNPLFYECSKCHHASLEPSCGKRPFSFGLSGHPMVWVVMSH